MEPVVIKTKGLRVTYDQLVALDSLSLSLPRGIIGLLGPNGAGKSTLIKVLIGLKKPVGGSVSVKGMVPWEQTLYLRDHVGYMPEYDCLIDEMNPVTLVSHFGRISGMEKGDTVWRAHEVLDFVGLGEERYRNIGTYSTGMKQKVKLAQAIVHDPPILFLDEPTEGMDPLGKEEMLKLIKRVGKTGKTVVVSSHQLHEIERTAEHIVILDRGKLLMEGPLKKILHGEEKNIRSIVIGEPDRLEPFRKYLKDTYQVFSSKIIGNELNVSMKWEDTGNHFFSMAVDHGLQVKEYRPHIRSLEDAFFLTFREGK